MRSWLLVVSLALPACPTPRPSPSPPPPVPSPTATPSLPPGDELPAAPPGAYDCSAPAEASGLLRAAPGKRVPGRYIVHFRALAQQIGARDVRAFGRIGAFAASFESEVAAVKALADPAVEAVEEVQLYETQAAPWPLDRIGQRQLPLNGVAERVATGRGTHFYGVDTGIDYSHPEFAGRTGDCWSATGETCGTDGNGHGTHTASSAAGATWGVAPDAVVHACNALTGSGSGTTTQVVRCITWSADHRELSRWPGVLNMSLGGGESLAIDKATADAVARGMHVAVAAGNEGTDACGGSPAEVHCALTVAASDRTDRRAGFSNHGRCVQVFAPGVDVPGAWPGGGQREASGTSMGAPHAAGALLALLEREPALSPTASWLRLTGDATRGVITDARPGTPPDLMYVGELP